jgi:D-glycero-D-manno-heptose 1,7-bisphosphate phosphatase
MVAGRPFLEWQVAALQAQSVRDVVLAIGYRAEAFADWIEAWSETPTGRGPDAVSICSFIEEEPLGTGGALPRLVDWLNDVFFVFNGDTLFGTPLLDLADLLLTSGSAGAVALREVPETSRYGAVRLEGDRVVSFAEKAGSGPGLINGGVYAFRHSVLAGMRSPCSLEQDLLPSLVEQDELVGLPGDGFFIDIGLPETYDEAQRAVPTWWATK